MIDGAIVDAGVSRLQSPKDFWGPGIDSFRGKKKWYTEEALEWFMLLRPGHQTTFAPLLSLTGRINKRAKRFNIFVRAYQTGPRKSLM